MLLFLWELFSIVYYCFPFPNTAFAKLDNSGQSAAALMSQGLYYVRTPRGAIQWLFARSGQRPRWRAETAGSRRGDGLDRLVCSIALPSSSSIRAHRADDAGRRWRAG
jgi:hypothetical protein